MTSVLPTSRRSRRLSAGILGAMLLVLAAPAASIADAEPPLAAAVESEPAPPVGTVTAFGPAVVTEGGGLVTTVEIANDSLDPVAGLGLRVLLTQAPLTTREAVAAFLEDPVAHGSRPIVERVLPPVPAGESTSTSLTASAASIALPLNTWGVYGVTVMLTGVGEPQVLDAMVFTWADAEIPTLPLAVVATASGSDARVGSLLAAADHTSVTLIVDPLAVRRVDGASTDVAAREAYRVPAGNPDLASLAHSSGQSIVEFALARSAEDVPRNLQGLPWIAVVPVVDEPTLQLAHDHNAVAAVVDSRYGAELPTIEYHSEGLPPAVADVTIDGSSDSLALMLPDPVLSQLLAQFRPNHPAAPARLVAETALIAAQGDGTQPVIASAGSSWMVDGTRTSPVITALFEAPWIAPVSLATVLSDTRRGTATVVGVEASEGDLGAASVDAIAARLAKLEHLAATTEAPEAVIDAPSALLLGVASLDARASQEDRTSAVQAVLESVDGTLGSVSITSGSALNLVSATGNVPVTVRNDLSVASTVTVRMTSNSPNIRITDSPVVTIPPQSEVTVLVPVSAVSSANVTMRLSLRNADNELIGTPRTLDIRVRADWGNAATAVFTVALVLLLIAGLVRTVRRGRKDTRTGPGEVAALEEPHSSELPHG